VNSNVGGRPDRRQVIPPPGALLLTFITIAAGAHRSRAGAAGHRGAGRVATVTNRAYQDGSAGLASLGYYPVQYLRFGVGLAASGTRAERNGRL
jgi:hypothetical protein